MTAPGSYWGHVHGDEWRWHLEAPASHPTISVIEPDAAELKRRADVVKAGATRPPFGFARALVEPDVLAGARHAIEALNRAQRRLEEARERVKNTPGAEAKR